MESMNSEAARGKLLAAFFVDQWFVNAKYLGCGLPSWEGEASAVNTIEAQAQPECRRFLGNPLVEESEKTDLQAAMQGAEQLQAEELAEFRIGLLHGRMKSEEKEQVMASYKIGRASCRERVSPRV